MFDRAELEIAIGVTLAAAILLGWLLNALWRRLSPVPTSHAGRIAVMARRLHEAEEARDAAIEARLEAEAALDARTAEQQRALAEQEARLTAAAARHEAELERALREVTADRDASMEGLRNARARILELEAVRPTDRAAQVLAEPATTSGIEPHPVAAAAPALEAPPAGEAEEPRNQPAPAAAPAAKRPRRKAPAKARTPAGSGGRKRKSAGAAEDGDGDGT